jgi:hypothetical protein
MSREQDIGQRLLVTLIDQHAAAEPSPVWSVVPSDENDLSKGFQDITFRDLANAVNHAAIWLEEHLPQALCEFQTIAYVGPKDVRYPIIAVAAAKIKRKVCASISRKCHFCKADISSYFYPHHTRLPTHKPISLKPQSARYICMERRSPHQLVNSS